MNTPYRFCPSRRLLLAVLCCLTRLAQERPTTMGSVPQDCRSYTPVPSPAQTSPRDGLENLLGQSCSVSGKRPIFPERQVEEASGRDEHWEMATQPETIAGSRTGAGELRADAVKRAQRSLVAPAHPVVGLAGRRIRVLKAQGLLGAAGKIANAGPILHVRRALQGITAQPARGHDLHGRGAVGQSSGYFELCAARPAVSVGNAPIIRQRNTGSTVKNQMRGVRVGKVDVIRGRGTTGLCSG